MALFINNTLGIGGAGCTLFMSERYSDVSVVVEHGENEFRYPAHSLLLSSMSDVLSNMLDSDMSEKSTKRIIISDSSPLAIKQFLRFIYTGEVKNAEWRDTVELLGIAHKYQVEPLINICEEELRKALSLGRACVLHEIAQLFSLNKLKNEAQTLILHSAFIILSTEGFENMDKKSIEYFISNRLLNVENELTVLHALKQWGKSECSRRGLRITEKNVVDVIQPFLRHIRFNSISRNQWRLIPESKTGDREPVNDLNRVKFFVPPMLHEHMGSLKFVVELGSFIHKTSVTEPLSCVKLSSEANLYILGFRIVGMFRTNFTFGNGNPMLILSKDDKKGKSVQFDLSSVPWKAGSAVGEYVWREAVAFFPNPARIDAFACYSLTVKYGNLLPTRWPKTKPESSQLVTELGTVSIYTFGSCAGVTELLLLPAPPIIKSCNSLHNF